jgi:hypothetical protein
VKVSITAGGREVELETNSDTNVSVKELAAEALALWKAVATGGMEGPGFGLTAELSTDRPATSAALRPMGVVE